MNCRHRRAVHIHSQQFEVALRAMTTGRGDPRGTQQWKRVRRLVLANANRPAWELEGAALSDHGAEEGVFAAESDGVEVADDDAVGLPERGAGVGDALGCAVGGDEESSLATTMANGSLMSNDGMRRIRLFQVSDLVLRQGDGQGADGVFQMGDLGCPDDGRCHRLLL